MAGEMSPIERVVTTSGVTAINAATESGLEAINSAQGAVLESISTAQVGALTAIGNAADAEINKVREAAAGFTDTQIERVKDQGDLSVGEVIVQEGVSKDALHASAEAEIERMKEESSAYDFEYRIARLEVFKLGAKPNPKLASVMGVEGGRFGYWHVDRATPENIENAINWHDNGVFSDLTELPG